MYVRKSRVFDTLWIFDILMKTAQNRTHAERGILAVLRIEFF